MHTIDLVRHHDLDRNLAAAGVTDLVEVIIGPSSRVARGWSEPIELLWIDGDHRYGVRSDIRNWSRWVTPGGTMAFHDYPGVGWSRAIARAVRRHVLAHPDRWRLISDRDHGSIVAFERLADRRAAVPLARRLVERAMASVRDVPSNYIARWLPGVYERLRSRRSGRE